MTVSYDRYDNDDDAYLRDHHLILMVEGVVVAMVVVLSSWEIWLFS